MCNNCDREILTVLDEVHLSVSKELRAIYQKIDDDLLLLRSYASSVQKIIDWKFYEKECEIEYGITSND